MKKFIKIASIGILSLSLVACGMQQQSIKTLQDSSLKEQCKNAIEQKDGSYKCEGAGGGSTGSTHSSSIIPYWWYFNGNRYDSQSAMTNSSDYKKNNLVNGTKHTSSKSDTKATTTKNSTTKSSTTKSSGFGSGGRASSGGS